MITIQDYQSLVAIHKTRFIQYLDEQITRLGQVMAEDRIVIDLDDYEIAPRIVRDVLCEYSILGWHILYDIEPDLTCGTVRGAIVFAVSEQAIDLMGTKWVNDRYLYLCNGVTTPLSSL